MANARCPTAPSSASVCAVLDGEPGAWPKFIAHWMLRSALIMPGLALGGIRDRRIITASLASSSFVSLFLLFYTVVERGRKGSFAGRGRARRRGRRQRSLGSGFVPEGHAHRVKIDGKATTLRYDRHSGGRGHQYLTPGNASSHAFPFPLQAGQRFRTGGHTYEVLDGAASELGSRPMYSSGPRQVRASGGVRFYANKYGLTNAEAQRLLNHPHRERIVRNVEQWRSENGFLAPDSAPVRGYLIERIASRPRSGLGARYRVSVRYRKFPTPTSLCVEAKSKEDAAAILKRGGPKGVRITRVQRGC